MFRVYFTNHGYFSQEQFETAEAAVEYGRRCGFEFSVWQGEARVASWTVFGGLRQYQTA